MASSGRRKKGSVKLWFIWSRTVVFFLTRARFVKFVYFSADVICE